MHAGGRNGIAGADPKLLKVLAEKYNFLIRYKFSKAGFDGAIDMVSIFPLGMMAGFLLIFYQSGWVWIYRPDESFDKNGNPHPILGCVTTVLCFVQPFMALLRPHPGASRYLLILHNL